MGGYHLNFSVKDTKVSFLLDTGASVTLLRKDIWDSIAVHSGKLLPYSEVKLVGVSGLPLTVHGTTTVSVKVNHDYTLPTDVLVVSPLTAEAILGLDFLQKHGGKIDLPNKRLHLSDRRISLPLQAPPMLSSPTKKIAVRAIERIEIQPGSIVEMMAKVDQADANGTWLLEESDRHRQPASVARALVQVSSGKVPIQLLNTRAETVTVFADTELATLEEAEIPVQAVQTTHDTDTSDKDKLEQLRQMVSETETDLSPVEKDKFFSLLCSFEDIFARSNSDLGKTSKLKHRINTETDTPIRQPVRRLPPHYRENVKKLLNEMLEAGVVEESTSPWASPIVLVKKKDGSVRFCVDYRKVNKITHRDAYPLPRIDSTLDTLSGAQWFSTLDLLSGYWQVEVDETDREKTAFCTTEGLFQFKVMPFGLSNAPATFQRLMDLTLAGLQWSQCLVYMDDVIVLGRTFQEHLDNLRSVFCRLREAGLKLKPCKCVFFRKSVKYLGHVVSRDGVSADPDKTKKVATWPIPNSIKEVQKFLGFASYYRRFIQDFAKIAKPLHRLTEGSTPFKWTAECHTAFLDLRQRLVSAPVLAHPDFNRQFILDTDASDTGLGAVLSQVDDQGREHVVAYGSRVLSKPERQYCVTRRELLAVVTFTHHLRPYLLGRRFLLRTDHGALLWLQNFREPEGQLARWLERLQELDFEAIHRKGRNHTNADALSRIPCQQCGRDSHNTVPSSSPVDPFTSVTSCTQIPSSQIAATSLQALQVEDEQSVRREQLTDNTLGMLLQAKETTNQKPNLEGQCVSRATKRLLQIWDQLVVHNGVLCRRFADADGVGDTLQVLVPHSLREEVLTYMHDSSLAGHLGVDKTLARLRERFYWPGYHDDVKDWCNRCASCATRKNPVTTPRAPLKSIKTGYPLQLVADGPISRIRSRKYSYSCRCRLFHKVDRGICNTESRGHHSGKEADRRILLPLFTTRTTAFRPR